jgi:hypothetical protein
MLAIGLPSRLAHEDDERGQDEDGLNREQDGGGEKDIAEEGICSIAETLIRDGPPAIRLVRLLARGLEDMAQAAMKRDQAALEDAAGEACDAMRELIGEGSTRNG